MRISTSSSSSDESDSRQKRRENKSQRKFGRDVWENVLEEKVDELPNGIDGLAKYSIKNIVDVKAVEGRLYHLTVGVGPKIRRQVGLNTAICGPQIVVDLSYVATTSASQRSQLPMSGIC